MEKNYKKVVITGVTRGLGEALAREFINLGHTVWGCGRSEAQISKLVATYRAPNKFRSIDVTNSNKLQDWADELIALSGPPDILINNAGLINARSPLWKISPDEFSKVIDVNVKGVAYSIRAFVPSMVANKKGTIINLSSGWGRFTSPEVAPYCASKFAVEGLSKSLAQELPAGMISVPLSPGIVNTDMLKQVFGPEADNYFQADKWAKTAVPFILNLRAGDNGKSLSIEEFS